MRPGAFQSGLDCNVLVLNSHYMAIRIIGAKRAFSLLWQDLAEVVSLEEVVNYTKAVELLPERGPFRGQLAHLLEHLGRLDEAEKHFRELLNVEPDNPVVHLWLARFLGKHRPQAKDEALKEAKIALELPPRKDLPIDKIEKIIQELQSKTAPAP